MEDEGDHKETAPETMKSNEWRMDADLGEILQMLMRCKDADLRPSNPESWSR